MRRKETCSLSLFIIIIIIHPPTVYIALSISSSLHVLSNDRLTGASLKEVVGSGCFNFFFHATKQKQKERKTKTKMCRDACETGSVDLGGWMNATYTYTYTALSLITLVFLFCRHSYKKSSGS